MSSERRTRERFLVELETRPDDDPAALTRRARQAAAIECQASGAPVRLLRSIYVPEDDSSFLLMEAGSVIDVRMALDAAGLATRSVDAAIHVEVEK